MNAILMPHQSPAAPSAREEALYEIVNGERVELPPMGIYSVWLTTRLAYHLGPYVDLHRFGNVVSEGLFILDAETNLRRRPDAAFVSAERWPLERALPETGDWAVVPDLAVEIISPHDTHHEVLAKMREYFTYDVRQVWVVAPADRSVYVYDAPEQVRIATDVLTDTIVPGFTLKLTALFQRQTT